MRETDLQKRCIDYLKSRQIYYLNIHGGGWVGKGSPDLIACIDGNFVAFELKVGKNDMSPAQRLHKLRIEDSGGLHYCVRTIGDFIDIVRMII